MIRLMKLSRSLRRAADGVRGYSDRQLAHLPLWQREFFDHVLRSSESYSEKWNYVRDNPVRAGLVVSAEGWALAGEVEELRM